MKTKKHLGQHFLKDRHLIDKILDGLEAKEGEAFLEIGPGPGTLTIPFNQRGFGFKVVEYDGDMVTHLQQLTWDPPVDIIHDDFMNVDIQSLIEGETKVFSNLPYNVSVPITARLLEVSERIPMMVLMYQKEVAERVRAQPGGKEYGPISVLVNLFYQCDLHFNVKPGSFRPPPKVMSQVIRLRRRDTPMLPLKDLAPMTKLVRMLFQHRRKTLSSSIKKFAQGWQDPDHLLASLLTCGLDLRARPENLSPADYVRWYHTYKGVV